METSMPSWMASLYSMGSAYACSVVGTERTYSGHSQSSAEDSDVVSNHNRTITQEARILDPLGSLRSSFQWSMNTRSNCPRSFQCLLRRATCNVHDSIQARMSDDASGHSGIVGVCLEADECASALSQFCAQEDRGVAAVGPELQRPSRAVLAHGLTQDHALLDTDVHQEAALAGKPVHDGQDILRVSELSELFDLTGHIELPSRALLSQASATRQSSTSPKIIH